MVSESRKKDGDHPVNQGAYSRGSVKSASLITVKGANRSLWMRAQIKPFADMPVPETPLCVDICTRWITHVKYPFEHIHIRVQQTMETPIFPACISSAKSTWRKIMKETMRAEESSNQTPNEACLSLACLLQNSSHYRPTYPPCYVHINFTNMCRWHLFYTMDTTPHLSTCGTIRTNGIRDVQKACYPPCNVKTWGLRKLDRIANPGLSQLSSQNATNKGKS